MKNKVLSYIKENHLLSRGDKVLAAVSAGADSVCLLHLLKGWQQELELKLCVVHIHHGIRGGEADRDADFAAELAKQLDLPFFLVRGDVPHMAEELGISMEEAGRKFRYEQFEIIRKREQADRIAVAHHRDDQAETVLFRLFRGSGVRGLSGMAPERGRIIRPLLCVGREEIRHFLQENHYEWLEDSTNRELDYSRNRIRGQILPLAEQQINAQAARHIADAADDMGRLCAYIEKVAKKAAKTVLDEENHRLWLEPFARQDDVIQEELLRLFVAGAVSGTKDVTRLHYIRLKELTGQETGKQIELPHGAVAERCHDSLRLFFRGEQEKQTVKNLRCDIPCRHSVKIGANTYLFRMEIKKREEMVGKIPEKDYTKWFDYDMIKDGLVLRNPREGDFFVMDEQGHRKKLNRYYRDCRIPVGMRNSQVVLADGSHVVWAVPGRISEAYKITNTTKRVLVITGERVRYDGRDQSFN